MKKLKIVNNSPVVIGFTLLCLASLILNMITNGKSNRILFSTYRDSLLNPLMYIRLFTHVLGHSNVSHFVGNITLLLVVGPLLEEKYGSKNILYVILITALVTSLVHNLLFPHVYLLGASGVVFAFILLSSFTSWKSGTIPVTFILVAIIYLGEQVYQGVFFLDNVSNLTHILGGVVGSICGFKLNRK